MANAGTVSVDFRAETDRFVAEVGKAQGALKSMDGNLKSLEKTAGIALRFLSAGAVFAFAKQAFNAADAIGDAADRAGIAVETFSRLKFAAEQSDVEFASLTTGLKKFQIVVSNAAEGGNAMSGSLAQIGLSGKALKGLALEDQLGKVAEAFRKIKDPADQTRVAVELFGRGGNELIPLLRDGAAGINKLTAEADRLGITMSGTTAAGVDQADKAIKRLTASATAFASKFAAGLSILILGPPDEQAKLDLRMRELQERQRQLLGGVGGNESILPKESPVRTELKAIGEELATLSAQWRVANGMIFPDKRFSRGPASRNPAVNIKSSLEEFDLSKINSLKLPEFNAGADQDVLRAQAQEQFRATQSTLAQELAITQRDIEAGVTADLQQQLEIRSQSVTAFQNQTLAAENAMLAARQNATAAGIQALQAFAGQSKKVAIALVLINKAKAISQAIQNTIVGATLQLTSGDPYTAVARASAVKAWGALQVAAIVASGYGEIQSINASGGAPRGSAVNPIHVNDTAADASGASSMRAVQVIVQGNVIGNRQFIDDLIDDIRDAVDDRDVVLISTTSRNAKELLGE